MTSPLPRIGLGTAQFGADYGIAGSGRVPLARVAEILRLAHEAGLDTLDTAVSYGQAESILGEVGVADCKVITKLPSIPEGCRDVEGCVLQTLEESLSRLRVDRVQGLLLHRPAELTGEAGEALFKGLERARVGGLATSMGISVYEPEELELLADVDLDVVQAR
jgi:aryl-alcohol dehydrogenase-like predicted oxidoreductase